jgi:cell pole-organizing protein PopZ
MAEGRNEPSMDEILSSIKRIIADDDRTRPLSAKRAAKDAPLDAEDEILELTEAATDSEMDAADEVLLDDSKARSLRHSFSALQTLSEPGVAPQIVRSGETSLEGLTRDLLRPMLKDWLDTNLPPIVEAMVEREINRITKKG